jgi:glutathione reductase (NADPH)
MTESQAFKSSLRFHTNRGTTTGWASSRRIGQKHAFYKVLVEDETGRFLGAHLFGHNAAEAINIFALAMKFGLTSLDLKKVLWAYPTHISDAWPLGNGPIYEQETRKQSSSHYRRQCRHWLWRR